MTGRLFSRKYNKAHFFVVVVWFSLFLSKGQIYFSFQLQSTNYSLTQCNGEYLARHVVSRHMSRRRRLVKRHVYLRFEQKRRNGVWRAKHNHSSRFVPYAPVAHIRDRKNNHHNGENMGALSVGRLRGIGAFIRPSSRLVENNKLGKKKKGRDNCHRLNDVRFIKLDMITSWSDVFHANGLKVFSSDSWCVPFLTSRANYIAVPPSVHLFCVRTEEDVSYSMSRPLKTTRSSTGSDRKSVV